MANVYIETLSRDVRRKLKNAEYTEREVACIHNAVRQRHLEKQVGFRRAAIILATVFVVIVGLSAISASAMPGAMLAIIAGALGGAMILSLAAAWYAANKMKLHFLSALKQGYPELAEQYGKHSFES